MPSTRSLIKLVTEQFSRLLRRREIIPVARRAMPNDFAAQLLQGIERERQAVLERLDVIEAEIAKLQELRRQARELELASVERIIEPAKTRRRLDGTPYVTPAQDRGLGVRTNETLRWSRAGRRIWRHIRSFEAEKQHRLNELSELRRLQAQAETGNLTALVRIAERFRTPVLLGGLAARIKGPSQLWGKPSDAAGNPLPDEALDADGNPLPMPRIPAVRDEPLIVHDTPVGG